MAKGGQGRLGAAIDVPRANGSPFSPDHPRLVCCDDFKGGSKARYSSSSTNSSSVAISSTKNVTEYHAVALVSTRRVALDPVDGLPGQAGLFGDPSDAHGLNDHRAYIGRKRSYTGDQLNKVRAMLGQQRGAISIAAPISPSLPLAPRSTLAIPIGPRREGGTGSDASTSVSVNLTTQRPR